MERSDTFATMAEEPAEEFDPAEAMRQDLADFFADLKIYRMPFGRYKGLPIHALPFEYLNWFLQKGDGFPSGRLGELMAFVHQTKADGAEAIFARLGRR